MNKSNNNRSNKNKKMKRIFMGVILGLLVICVATLGILYMLGERYYSTHFVKNTVINDIDVSDMTIQELNERIAQYTLTVYERAADGSIVEETISGDRVGLELSSTDELNQILESQGKGQWLFQKGQTIEISDFVDYNEGTWDRFIKLLQCFSEDFVQAPTDAYVSDYDEENNTYYIIPETQGNKLKKKKAIKVLSDAIRQLEPEVNLEDYDCYEKPAILQDDEGLKTLLENLNHYVNVTITYTFGDTVEVVDGDLINQWLIRNEDNSVTLDTTYVDEFVVMLRKRYDTIFRPRTFMTSYGKEVSLSTGDYGWWMNYSQEMKELAAMIEDGMSGERTPVYYQTAAQYGSKDYGDTYIEINLTAQHLFYYEDGKLVLETDFVSGNAARGNATPDGVYALTYKERNATLTGEDYATPVSYWMPFNMHIGLHDATWRYQFGSDLYKTSGSHGCINLPYVVAQELYSRISKGIPVICYYLEGTESDSITVQTSEQIAQSVVERINEIGTVTKEREKAILHARSLYDELNAAEKKMVTNYDVLVEAEKKFEELKK